MPIDDINKVLVEFYKKNQKALTKLQSNEEKKILEAYARALFYIRKKLKELYNDYSIDGALSNSDKTTYMMLLKVSQRISSYMKKKNIEVIDMIGILTEEQYEEAFFRMGYAIEQSTGLNLQWGIIDEKAIEIAVTSPFEHLMKSKSFLIPREKAIEKIREDITLAIIRGDSFETLSKRISEVLGVDIIQGKYYYSNKGLAARAMTIARTEGMRVLNQAHSKAYAKAKANGCDIEEIWDATLDNRTRPSHGYLDQKPKDEEHGGWFVPELGTYVPGPHQSGIPSFDINCRCRTTCRVKGIKDTQRRVKGEGITTYKTYNEWKKEHPAFDSKSLGSFSREHSDFKTVKDNALKQSPNELVSLQKKAISMKTPRYMSKSSSYCDFENGYISYNLNDFSERAYWHEMGHWIDYAMGITDNNKTIFYKAKDSFVKQIKATEWNETKGIVDSLKRHISEDSDYRALSDFLYIMSDGLVSGKWTHATTVYSLEKEAWANMFSIMANANKGKSIIEKLFPEIYDLYVKTTK